MLVKTSEGLLRVASDYDSLSQELFGLAHLLEKNDKFNFEEKIMSLVRVAESTTVDLRSYAARLMRKEVRQFYSDVVDLMGVSVLEHEKWIEITVPGILPGRDRHDSHAFLTRPLRHALIEFQRSNPIERFGQCAICIVHQYDVALGLKRIRDYDNIETKRYLDVIESVLLTNDSGLLCTVLQTTEVADRDATKFFLMQPETLANWTRERVKTHTTS